MSQILQLIIVFWLHEVRIWSIRHWLWRRIILEAMHFVNLIKCYLIPLSHFQEVGVEFEACRFQPKSIDNFGIDHVLRHWHRFPTKEAQHQLSELIESKEAQVPRSEDYAVDVCHQLRHRRRVAIGFGNHPSEIPDCVCVADESGACLDVFQVAYDLLAQQQLFGFVAGSASDDCCQGFLAFNNLGGLALLDQLQMGFDSEAGDLDSGFG